MRLIEIRTLDGPNLYRLSPVLKLEVAIGRRRTWFGQREPAPYNLVRLGAAVPSGEQPARIPPPSLRGSGGFAASTPTAPRAA